MQSCIDTFEMLRSGQHAHFSALPLPNPSHKRKSAPEHLEPLMTNPQPKRRQSGVETLTSARDIRPKPTSSNGSPHPFSSFSGQSAVPTKKRGRPSKADVEERQREAILRGEVLPPPKTMAPKGGKQAVTGEPSSAGYAAIAPMGSAPEMSGGIQYQSGPIEAAPVSAPTPAAMVPTGDSPGKKKRARATPRQPKVGILQEWERKKTNSVKVSKPGESSFSITTPQPVQPQPLAAPQVSTPITPSQPFHQHRPDGPVTQVSQLIQSEDPRQYPPPEPQIRPDPPPPPVPLPGPGPPPSG